MVVNEICGCKTCLLLSAERVVVNFVRASVSGFARSSSLPTCKNTAQRKAAAHFANTSLSPSAHYKGRGHGARNCRAVLMPPFTKARERRRQKSHIPVSFHAPITIFLICLSRDMSSSATPQRHDAAIAHRDAHTLHARTSTRLAKKARESRRRRQRTLCLMPWQ